jgi:diaminopimelate decarboxylase
MYGKMKDSLKMQFNTRIPTYEEYAQKAAAFIADHFQNAKKRPTLFIEPGSALVGDVMRFAAPVVSIKDIRGKAIATLLGSVYNINPTLNRKNPPITVYSDALSARTEYENLDFGGYTCIESDYLYKGYNGPLAVGDIVVFENVGSYSVVLKPPFILPNFPIIEWDNGHTSVVKRKESFDDLFHTYKFDF